MNIRLPYTIRVGVAAVVALCFAQSVIAAAKLPQDPAQDAPKGGQTPTAPAIVKRSVGPDNTAQIEYADGTTRRVPLGTPTSPSEQPNGEASPASSNPLEPTAPPAWLKDPATNQAFLEAVRDYYAYRASGLQHRRRLFEWQLISSKIIFVTVLMLVGAGIVFAALQFRIGLKRTTADARDVSTELDLSTKGVKVSSPVLGVIILVISFAFFYLYLVYVYPITELV